MHGLLQHRLQKHLELGSVRDEVLQGQDALQEQIGLLVRARIFHEGYKSPRRILFFHSYAVCVTNSTPVRNIMLKVRKQRLCSP